MSTVHAEGNRARFVRASILTSGREIWARDTSMVSGRGGFGADNATVNVPLWGRPDHA